MLTRAYQGPNRALDLRPETALRCAAVGPVPRRTSVDAAAAAPSRLLGANCASQKHARRHAGPATVL